MFLYKLWGNSFGRLLTVRKSYALWPSDGTYAWGMCGTLVVGAFRPKGRGFDYCSSRHIGTLGKSFSHSCQWRFGVKFRHSIRPVSGAPVSSSGLGRGAIEIA